MDVEIKDLNKSFGENRVLRDVCAVFPGGRVSAVLAPSGQGKSTLLRILTGLEKADSGSISGLPEKMSVLFQEDRLFPQLTAAQNVLALAPKTTRRDDVMRVLEKLGIVEAADSPVTELSGGMARRAALARALLAESDILFLDEPFRGLDAENKARTAQTIREYAAGKTVILFAHGVEEAELLGAEFVLELKH